LEIYLLFCMICAILLCFNASIWNKKTGNSSYPEDILSGDLVTPSYKSLPFSSRLFHYLSLYLHVGGIATVNFNFSRCQNSLAWDFALFVPRGILQHIIF
jgi:hypothetical protein